MNGAAILFGLLMVGMGAFAVKFPMRIRSHPSGREWQQNPDKAARKQRIWGFLLGLAIIALGVFGIVWGLIA
ncbi:hypothetical protein [Halosimplex marinum]|uniref:hypothetical protein n=1 Tax=Halosimplex marinum TaxID=3396620 RepID=UPI003F5670EC